eukprot:scaffold101114_cov61-Attheya_sp.AAC.2
MIANQHPSVAVGQFLFARIHSGTYGRCLEVADPVPPKKVVLLWDTMRSTTPFASSNHPVTDLQLTINPMKALLPQSKTILRKVFFQE